MRDALERPLRFVTEHNVVVLLVMLLATAGVVAGVGQLQTQSEANASSAVGDTEVAQKLDYIRANYGGHDNESDNATAVSPAPVYVRSDGERPLEGRAAGIAALPAGRARKRVGRREPRRPRAGRRREPGRRARGRGPGGDARRADRGA
ncbi:hypothetical protein ACFQL4_16980 [Halosimplex aquaticum]